MRHLTLTAALVLTTACGQDVNLAALNDDAVLNNDEVVLDVPQDTDEADEQLDTAIEEEDEVLDTGDTQEEELYAAPADFDTFDAPLDHYRFTPYATREVTFGDDISHPTGDRDDWFSFSTIASENHITRVELTLDCDGNTEGIVAQIWSEDDGTPLSPNKQVGCNQGTKDFSLDSNAGYVVRVFKPHDFDEGHSYTLYALTVEN